MNARPSRNVNTSEHPFVYTAKISCVPYIDESGKQWFVRIERSDKMRNNTRNVYGPMYTEQDFASAPDGIYTWILSDSPKGRLAAIQARSLFEIGSLHRHIAERAGASKVYAAGELRKTGPNTVEVNVMSGTYSLTLMGNTGMSESDLKSWAAEQFRAFGLTVDELPPETILTDRTIPLRASELALYKSLGFLVKLYPNRTNCVTNEEFLLEVRILHSRDYIERIKNDIQKYTSNLQKNPALMQKWINLEHLKLKNEEEKLQKLLAEQAAFKANPPYVLFGQTGGRKTRRRKAYIKKTRKYR